MSRREEKIALRCPTCHGRKRLWLGGKDYVECPTCDATGALPLIEARITPPIQFSCSVSRSLITAQV